MVCSICGEVSERELMMTLRPSLRASTYGALSGDIASSTAMASLSSSYSRTISHSTLTRP